MKLYFVKFVRINKTALNFISHTFKDFSGIVLINYLLLVVSRLTEFLLLATFHNPDHLASQILTGAIADIFLFTLLLSLLFPLYGIMQHISLKIAQRMFLLLTILFWTLHFLILSYYISEFKALDTFLFQYPWKEIVFTIRTSGSNWVLWVLLLFLPILLIFLFYRKFLSIHFRTRYFIILFLLSFPGYLICRTRTGINDSRQIAVHKSIYFYVQTWKYFSGKTQSFQFDAAAIRAYQKEFNDVDYLSMEYPYLHKASRQSVLSSYFKVSETAPNVVFLIVEGLSNKFVNDIEGIHLMPFLDSLKSQSLYWDHFLTNGERSFAVVPSLTGSLPYGRKGFTFLDRLPCHFDLVNVLNANGYFTGFFYGQGAWTHHKDRFLMRSGINLIFDKGKFTQEYRKIITGNDKYFWGFNDKQLFSQYAAVSDTLPGTKRLDILFTGSMHPPFAIENKTYYRGKLQASLKDKKNELVKRYFNTYERYFLAVMFTDDALRMFFEKYRTRVGWGNTIFIITGDHPMTEVPPENSLKRYHVPLIIYSPLLKTSATFHGIGSHLDLFEPLLALLQQNYGVKTPELSSALSTSINIDAGYNFNKKITLMNDNREIVDMLWNGYFMSNEKELYKVRPNFVLSKIKDHKLLLEVKQALDLFRKTNTYVSLEDKLMPDSVLYRHLGKNIFYNLSEPAINHTTNEFISVTPPVKLPNIPLKLDISFQYATDKINKLPCGVIQLKNKNDSIVFWQSFQIPGDKYTAQYNITLKQQSKQLDSLQFQFYFWNQEKIKFGASQIKVIISN